MKPIKTLLILVVVALACMSCQKDPLEEVNEGLWNKERNILGITFHGQIGDAVLSRKGDTATIQFIYNTASGSDLSKVALSAMELSYGASASFSVGDTLNFDNAEKMDSILVTASNGNSLYWYITLTPFTEALLGTWKISGLYVYGGTGAQWGGAALFKMSDRNWCWKPSGGPAAEQDNMLTFTLTGVNSTGNTYGTVVNNAGADGLYADFLFIFSEPDVDANSLYRKIPIGTSTWLRDYSAGTVTFTSVDGIVSSALFSEAGTETVYGTITKTITDHAFVFTMTGRDDWTNIYNDIDKFVSNPHKYWVDIAKQ